MQDTPVQAAASTAVAADPLMVTKLRAEIKRNNESIAVLKNEISTQEGFLEEAAGDKSRTAKARASRMTKLKKEIAAKQVCHLQ